jgi:mono/diheme cytochrome c family protein
MQLIVVLGSVLALGLWFADAAPRMPQGAAAPASDATAVLKKGNAERGLYIATHVAMCIECHSERDQDGTIIPGRQYMGGPIPTRPAWAQEWAERAPRNAGLPGYDDHEALRLLTEGAIARDGRQLRPPMPRFRMTPEDAADVIAFMRSLS